MKKIIGVLACFLISSAHAVVIDFEEIDNTTGNAYSGNSLNSQGYNFLNSSSGSTAILHWSEFSSSNADPGGVTYSHNYSGTTTTLTKIGGGAFDLTSIDFGNVYNHSPYAQNFQITGYYQGGGSVQQNITSDALSGLETFMFNWTALTSVTWTETSGTFLQLDNVVVNENSTIPEPTAIALMGLGLLGFGVSRRKFNK